MRGEHPSENCNAATRNGRKKIKKVGETFVNRNQIFVPLHRRNERSRGRLLIEKIARIKSRICAH